MRRRRGQDALFGAALWSPPGKEGSGALYGMYITDYRDMYMHTYTCMCMNICICRCIRVSDVYVFVYVYVYVYVFVYV